MEKKTIRKQHKRRNMKAEIERKKHEKKICRIFVMSTDDDDVLTWSVISDKSPGEVL